MFGPASWKTKPALMRLGLSFLILASAARWFVRPSVTLSPDTLDAGLGVLYGLSIGCLLASLSMRRSGRPTS